MRKRFRKRPGSVWAEQWFFGTPPLDGMKPDAERTVGYYTIMTAGGKRPVNDGDWIVKGSAGETFVCTSERFELAYESAETGVPPT